MIAYIYVIFSWAQRGRSTIFGREIGVPDREVFSVSKIFNFSVKIIICSTVDHCKMFYLPAYGKLEVYEICQFHSGVLEGTAHSKMCR